MRKWLLLILVGGLLQSCVTQRMQTVWKAEHPLPYRYDRILVIAILPEGNDSMQATVEKLAVQQLQQQGYQAVSYVDGSSIYGISQSTTQEAAYFTLCDKGIDAVLTLAKVDPGSVISLKKGAIANYPATFYFNHIWDYRELASTINYSKTYKGVWECILFDLRSLQPQVVLQANEYSGRDKNEPTWIAASTIEKMLNEKAIVKETNLPVNPKKGF